MGLEIGKKNTGVHHWFTGLHKKDGTKVSLATILEGISTAVTGLLTSKVIDGAGVNLLKVNADGSINAAAAGVAPNDTIIQGTLTLDGTTQQLAADVGAKTFTVQAAPGNSGQVYVGNATLDGTNGGVELSPGSSKDFNLENVNLVYVKGTLNDIVTFIGEV